MLLLRGLAANPNEHNAININQQYQSGVAKAWWAHNPWVLGSSRVASVGREHLKVKEASPQVKLTESKSTQESHGQSMNQPCRSC
jgi:hypothetical protein